MPISYTLPTAGAAENGDQGQAVDLDPYVERERLGFIYRPRAVVRYDASECEPDLMVRQPHPAPVYKDFRLGCRADAHPDRRDPVGNDAPELISPLA